MDTQTGKIYDKQDEILAALVRGEPLVPVSQKVADTMRAGQRVMNRADRRAAQRFNRKAERLKAK